MSKEIYISSTPHETRLAICEKDELTEIYYERENEYTLAGSIYNGRVTRVLPGMQSSFVDIGLERDAFLYITDFMEEAGDAADFELPMVCVRVVATVPVAMVADARKKAPARRWSRLERKLRRGLRVPGKADVTVGIAADVTGTVIVGAVMSGRVRRRVSLWLRWQRERMRDLTVRRVKVTRLAKVLRVPMAAAGGVDAVDGVVDVAVKKVCRQRVRVLPLLQ